MTAEVAFDWRLPHQRRRLIAAYVTDNSWATVAELSETFRISLATARRDLDVLARQNKLVRVHGGAGAVVAVPRTAPVAHCA